MWTCCDHPGNVFKKDWVITLEIGSVFPLCNCTHLSTWTRSRWFARVPRGPAVGMVWLNVPTCLTREVSRGSIKLRYSIIRARLIHTVPLDGENVLCTSRERTFLGFASERSSYTYVDTLKETKRSRDSRNELKIARITQYPKTPSRQRWQSYLRFRCINELLMHLAH